MKNEGYFYTTAPPTTTLSSKAVAVKVINPEKRSESKLLMLRNVDTGKLDSPCELKHMIYDQFGGETVRGNLTFDVGYYKQVCLVSLDDMEDVNKLLCSTDGHEVTLWCMGCTTKQKGSVCGPSVTWIRMIPVLRVSVQLRSLKRRSHSTQKSLRGWMKLVIL